MDDASGVAEVDAVDQLEHYESDLLLRYRVLVLREVFLQVVLRELEDQVQLLFTWCIDHVHQTESRDAYLTMLGWGFNSFRMEISRIAVEGTP